ncbi:aminoglycoside phosphotransferase family protein [Bacillus sp. RG28]|uniref:Aminoglycoside phosphotransferase family protein n=1 Tax=Gottfriedia endophytica TaxID=2820819 RepID=A0A940NNA7_9BACI|nr:aminoglycoside phosphotransferase family protein [Gottfriedia endophytica]MBP0724568.1 aminoglycoside phosphotransferase family protein [Gottfriedia endophytica]
MNIEIILNELNITSFLSYENIIGGRDSSVWKVKVSDEDSYALRLIPKHRHQQFKEEKMIIQLAEENGIPVPKVHFVKKIEDYSLMLMDWVAGKTIFNELYEYPENAREIGIQFGKVQAAIHMISLPKTGESGSEEWLSPKTSEENEILDLISTHGSKNENVLLHLDYHPLNVLTDGEKITAVIDWNNASRGDYRFDLARTLSILRIEATKPGTPFENSPSVIEEFEKGWLEGYGEIRKINIEPLSLYNAWAGIRMKRDLSENLLETDRLRIQQWISYWLEKKK